MFNNFLVRLRSLWRNRIARTRTKEYRIRPDILTFLVGASLSLVVVLGTIGVCPYRAAVANPVNNDL